MKQYILFFFTLFILSSSFCTIPCWQKSKRKKVITVSIEDEIKNLAMDAKKSQTNANRAAIFCGFSIVTTCVACASHYLYKTPIEYAQLPTISALCSGTYGGWSQWSAHRSNKQVEELSEKHAVTVLYRHG